jgi:pimeloyl-ACP methyl ester carboxylesterase
MKLQELLVPMPWQELADHPPTISVVPMSLATSWNAQIAYDVAGGRPGGRDVVLLQTLLNDRRSWRSVVDRLAPRHRCVTYDARGHGETTYKPRDGWSPVDDAVAVLDAAEVDTAVLVACGGGGQNAVDLTLAHPDRVEGLVLIGAAIRGAPYPELPPGPAADVVAEADAADEARDWDAMDRLDAWIWLDGPAQPEGRVSGPVRDLFQDMNAKALRAPHPGDQRPLEPAWPRLAEIAVPTLVMVGSLDLANLQQIDEQAAELIPGARFVRLEGVAHVPHLEGDPTTLAEIAAFVDSL